MIVWWVCHLFSGTFLHFLSNDWISKGFFGGFFWGVFLEGGWDKHLICPILNIHMMFLSARSDGFYQE